MYYKNYMMTKNKLSVFRDQRSDIQILRGVSVLAVIFYHLGLPIHSGHLGVDSFFVISGFVITATLLRSNGTLKTRITGFYKKRVRRIFPASIYIAILTGFACFLFLPRIYLKNYLFDTAASLFMVANIHFANNGIDYMQDTLDASPFLHYWSLGVEEQFYLVWPIFLLSLFRWKIIYYVSLPVLYVVSIITTQVHPTLSFYSPTSRAWEFLVGAYVATLPKYNGKKCYRIIILSISALVLLGSLYLPTSSNNKFQPVTVSIVLAVGTLIYVGFSNRYLSPVKHVGNFSFTLYLVHWPIIAILVSYFTNFSSIQKVGIIIFSIILAWLLSENIENPIRFKENYLKSKNFWLAIFIPFVFLYVVFSITVSSQSQARWSFEIDNSIPIIYSNYCHTNASAPKKSGCDYGDLNSKKLVMLVGDSHAAQWFPGFEKASQADGIKLRIATKSGCPAILSASGAYNERPECHTWQSNMIQYINSSKPNIVVISNLTEENSLYNRRLTPELYIKYLTKFIAALNTEIKVTIIGDTPYPERDSVGCLAINWKQPTKCDLPNKFSLTTALTKELEILRTNFVDSRSFLCNEQVCPAVLNGKNVYRDGSHLSISTIDVQETVAKLVFANLR